ncbi:DUF5643 domain-containing protein [Paenibacillus sp. BJ-4]|uniref:DUF5643 domain-containing protein n=1 Tax=Paenibacillus sp. BJ-4 TaxID=2878097 RepID=UPI001CF01658|nr:DUF5643 domain-containing protein [Paenibacillus sp. BJ-4]
MEQHSKLKRIIFKSVIVASATMIMGTGVTISDTASQIQAAAATSTASAASTSSLTRDGVTLTIKKVKYDGIRLSVQVERKGINKVGMMPSYSKDKSRKLEKGYLLDPQISIHGEKIKLMRVTDAVFQDGNHKKMLDNAVEIIIDKGLSDKNLPDTFEMALKISVSGIKEPFAFKVPVENTAKDKLVLKPEKTKSSGGFSYTVKQIELASDNTQIIIDSNGKVPSTAQQTGNWSATKMYYDIADSQGKLIEQDAVGILSKAPALKYHEVEMYAPFAARPSSITIRPYTLTVDKKWNPVEDAQGKWVKTYHKDLEMVVPVE